MAAETKKLWQFRVYNTKARQVTGSFLVRPPKKMSKTEFKEFIKLYFRGKTRTTFWEFIK